MENMEETVEALIFASGNPLSKKDIVEKIPALTTKELNNIISSLKEKYSGNSGIILKTFNEKMQFGTNPKYGDVLAEVLTPIKEKELSRSLLEVLSIIAYKQPITRGEMEDIKGSSAEYQISVLEKVGLIVVVGRKNTVGRPLLYATTDEFLKRLQLEDLSELPDYKQVLERIAILNSNFNERRDTLFSNRSIADGVPDEVIVEPTVRIPEILLRENTNVIAADVEQFEFDDDVFNDDDEDDFFSDDDKVETFE
jgi:segregation and condensation protein B